MSWIQRFGSYHQDSYIMMPISYVTKSVVYIRMPVVYIMMPVVYIMMPIAYIMMPVACIRMPMAYIMCLYHPNEYTVLQYIYKSVIMLWLGFDNLVERFHTVATAGITVRVYEVLIIGRLLQLQQHVELKYNTIQQFIKTSQTI